MTDTEEHKLTCLARYLLNSASTTAVPFSAGGRRTTEKPASSGLRNTSRGNGMRYAKKRDMNEGMIISALRAAGCKVMQLDKFDLLVQRGREKHLLEVKMPNGRIEKSQQAMIDEGWDLRIVHDVNEALNAVGIHDPRALDGLSFDL